MALKDYSTTPSSNDGLGLFDENQAPNTVNDGGRQAMADTRAFYEGIEWRDWGHTPTRTANTTFTVPGDQTAVYTVNRRLKLTDTTTLYGTISASAYTTLTTITVTLDSGALSASLSAVELGLEPSNSPIDKVAKSEKLVDSNGLDVLLASATASAVNEITATNAAAGNAPKIEPTGDDTNISLTLQGKGTGKANIDGNAATITSQGALATLDTVDSAQIAANAVGTTQVAAGAIDSLRVASSAITQSKLATNQATVSIGGPASGNQVLGGGEYGKYPRVWASLSSGSYEAQLAIESTSSSTTAATLIYLTTADSMTVYASQRFETASSPYNLGDGDIQLFVFARIDNATRKIEALYISPTGPWHYNGPTNIAADFVGRDGRKYQRVKDLSNMPLTLEQALRDPIARQEYLLARRGAPYMPREITQAIKNADMNLIPHPFIHNDLTGKTIVLLDPVSSIVNELAELYNEGENVNEIIHNGNLVIGNEMLNRSGPAGLLIPSVRWK